MNSEISDFSEEMQQAIQLLSQGKATEAEELMQATADAIEREHGAESHRCAVAQNELGIILINVGQTEKAIAAYRKACAGPMPAEEQQIKDRLTFGLNLGQALEVASQIAEAESVFRDNLDQRLKYFGKDHAGYGFGLEPLARNLFRQERLDEARLMIDDAVENFMRNQHPRIASALVLRALIWKSLDISDHPFEHLEEIPPECLEPLPDHVFDNMELVELPVIGELLDDLLPFLRHRLGPDHQSTIKTLSAIANVQRQLGNHERRLEVIQEAISIFDRQERTYEALNATLALAVTRAEAGDKDGARASFRDALVRAHLLGDPAEKSVVLRHYGKFLAEMGEREDADKNLRLAVTEAEHTPNLEMLGCAQIACGVFLQHSNILGESRVHLDAGLHNLPPEHPEYQAGRDHLDAILAGSECGCNANH